MGSMLRHALAPFYPGRIDAGGSLRLWWLSATAVPRAQTPAPSTSTFMFLSLDADRHRTDRGRTAARPAGPSPAPAGLVRRSTSSLAVCRCATTPTGSRSSSRSTRPCAARPRRFTRRVSGTTARATRRRWRRRRPKIRSDRRRTRCCCRIRSSRRTKRWRRAARSAAWHARSSVYQPAPGSFEVEVGESTTEQIMTVGRDDRRAPHARQCSSLPSVPPLDVEIWGDEERPAAAGQRARAEPRGRARGHRVGVGAARHDLAAERRRHPHSGNGFSLAGTVSKPANAAGPAAGGRAGRRLRPDRSRRDVSSASRSSASSPTRSPTPGFVVLRYDKRGIGQSGGRAEAARARPTTPRRAGGREGDRAIARTSTASGSRSSATAKAAGRADGGAKDERIAAVGLVATLGVTGADSISISHARRSSGRTRTEPERQAKIDLQKQIQQAVITGKGWDRDQRHRSASAARRTRRGSRAF